MTGKMSNRTRGYIDKNTMGKLGLFELWFTAPRYLFSDIEMHQEEALPTEAWTKNYDWACLSSHGNAIGFLGVTAQDFYEKVFNIKIVKAPYWLIRMMLC